jgi:hypothetical protein
MRLLWVWLLFCRLLLRAQPPAINQEGVFNAASRMPPSLPGDALAGGARIVIEGLRFEPASEVRLGGTAIKVLSSSRRQLSSVPRSNRRRELRSLQRQRKKLGTGAHGSAVPPHRHRSSSGAPSRDLRRGPPRAIDPHRTTCGRTGRRRAAGRDAVPVVVRLSNGSVSNTVAVPIGRCDPPNVHSEGLLLLGRSLARVRPHSLSAVDFT